MYESTIPALGGVKSFFADINRDLGAAASFREENSVL